MGIYNTNSAITAIKHIGSEINAVYHMGVKVWPDAPTEQFTIVHTKRSYFTVTVVCSTYNLVTINWGDGTTTIVNNSAAKSHTYALSGNHTVTITGDLTKITTFYCNSQLASSITFTSNCFNITDFQCYSNSLTSLDVSYLTQLTTFHCYSNSSLSSVIMPTMLVNRALRDYRLYSTAISTYINPVGADSFNVLGLHLCANLNSIHVSNITSSNYFYVYSCPNLTSIDVSSMSFCKDFQAYSCTNLTSINAINLASCSTFKAYSCTNLTSINVNNLTSCTYFHVYSCPNLNPPTLAFTSIYTIRLDDCQFSSSEVDIILANCLALNLSSVRIYLDGNNAAPSAAGYTTKAALAARSWSITTN